MFRKIKQFLDIKCKIIIKKKFIEYRYIYIIYIIIPVSNQYFKLNNFNKIKLLIVID